MKIDDCVIFMDKPLWQIILPQFFSTSVNRKLYYRLYYPIMLSESKLNFARFFWTTSLLVFA